MRFLQTVGLLLLTGWLGCTTQVIGTEDTCGDGELDSWESCDGNALGGQTCETLGFDSGTLACSGGCQWDTSGCVGRQEDLCPDGVCQPSEDVSSCPQDCGGVALPALPATWGTPGQWWVLTHPNYTSTYGPGAHLVDTSSGELIRTLALPDGVGSPHGMAAGPDEVWISDMDSGLVHRLSSTDGALLGTLPGGRSEGLTFTASGYWTVRDPCPSSGCLVTHHDPDGTETLSFPLETNLVNDLAYDGHDFYYVLNGATDPIMRVDLINGTTETLVAHTIDAVYTLAFDGEALVVDNDYGAFDRYDPETGALMDTVAHGITGWVTAIAPAWGVGAAPPR